MTAQCVDHLQRTDWDDALESELAQWWLEHSDTVFDDEQQDGGDLLFYLSAASEETVYAPE